MQDSESPNGNAFSRAWHQHWTIRLMALGIAIGALSGGVVLAFRLAIVEATEVFTLGQGFAGLSPLARLFLPAAGGLGVGLLAYYVFPTVSEVGVSRVLEKVAYGASRLQARGAFAQFLYGILAIGSGHSVGREGPSIHMGAAVGSLLGQRLDTSPEHLRILVAAGAAGAFAGALNIPLAGVVFVLEVILSEYSLMLFAPVAVSAVVATMVANMHLGGHALFTIPQVTPHEWWYLPADLVIGLGAALVSYFLLRGLEGIHHLGQRLPVPPWALPAIGGLLVGAMAAFSPQVMGVSYHLLDSVFSYSMGLPALVFLLIAKLTATIISLGMYSRGGAVGPALFLGALVGAIMYGLMEDLTPLEPGGSEVYGIVGMAAGLAAILNAPFTATVAVFELVKQPAIIPITLIATVSAAVTSRDWFKAQSVFAWTLHLRELSEPSHPVGGQKCTIPVNKVMKPEFMVEEVRITPQRLQEVQTQSGLQGVVPVLDKDRFLGIVSLSGLLQVGMAPTEDDGRIDLQPFLHQSEELRNLYPGDGVVKALDLMASYGLEGYPVLSPRDTDRVVGLISQEEAFWACVEEKTAREGRA